MSTTRPTIACLGAGRMGRGIAVAFAYAGHGVTMIDVKVGRSTEQFRTLEAEALDEVRKTLVSLARFGLLKEAEADVILARVSVVAASEGAAALRFLNVHWLNPAYLIPLVEISPGKATDPEIVARVKMLLEGCATAGSACAAAQAFWIIPA